MHISRACCCRFGVCLISNDWHACQSFFVDDKRAPLVSYTALLSVSLVVVFFLPLVRSFTYRRFLNYYLRKFLFLYFCLVSNNCCASFLAHHHKDYSWGNRFVVFYYSKIKCWAGNFSKNTQCQWHTEALKRAEKSWKETSVLKKRQVSPPAASANETGIIRARSRFSLVEFTRFCSAAVWTINTNKATRNKTTTKPFWLYDFFVFFPWRRLLACHVLIGERDIISARENCKVNFLAVLTLFVVPSNKSKPVIGKHLRPMPRSIWPR